MQLGLERARRLAQQQSDRIDKFRLPGTERRLGCCDGGLLSPGLRHVERRGDTVAETVIHKLHVLFGEAEIAFRNPETVLRSAQLNITLRQFGDCCERDAMPVLHGRQRVGVGRFHGAPHATEQVQLPR